MKLQVILLLLCLLCAVAVAREVPITILHTCDLHGNILPVESYEGEPNLGGLARCATAIRKIRAEQPNVLLFDAGDTFQGAAVSYLSDGKVMIGLLNQLRYDAWIWGNHEFDWGLEKLAACAELAEMPVLAANLHGAGPIAARVKPYRIMEVDGVKVGIIGLTTLGIPTWSRPQLIAGLRFEDSVETLRTVVPEIRKAGAKVIVLVAHQGYREDGDDHADQVNAIARHFPEVDVVIGAHTHRNFSEFKINNMLYTQAAYHGIRLGRMDLVYDTTAGQVTRRESKTILMDESFPLDPAVLNACAPELERAKKTLRSVIGEATGDFDVRNGPKRETAMHNLIFESIASALSHRNIKVDAIVHGVLEKRMMLKPGPVTVGDVWRAVPYENTLGVCYLNEAELREILDENVEAYNNPSFRGIWGLRWEFNPKAAAGWHTVKLTRPDGTLFCAGERLAVVFNSYDLAGGGLRWPKLLEIANRPDCQLLETEVQTRQAVLDYIRQQGKISPVIHGWWKVTGDTDH